MTAAPADVGDDAPAHWRTWSTTERESFFTAIARHRRAAWRVTAACVVGYAVLTVIVAVLMAPLLWGAVGLLVDVANVVVPLPDLLGWLGRLIDPLIEDPPLPLTQIAGILAIAGLPGLLAMFALSRALSRVLTQSPLFDGEGLGGRNPIASVLAEQRLRNVTDEMALAAGLKAPRLLIVPGGVNAAAVGRDGEVTILVGEMLLQTLKRDQMQGALAHLIGSVADGDLTIGRRTAVTLAMFAMIARFSSALSERDTLARTLGLWRVFLRPTSANTSALLRALVDPFDDDALPPGEMAAPSVATPAPTVERGGTPNTLTWRQWAAMPLAGPLVLSGFLGGLVSKFMLGPLVSFAWRERKYMADATAVRLTRDPDALAGALAAMAGTPTGLPGWATHLAVAGSGAAGGGGLFGGTIADIFPSYERRGRALVKMGASVAPVSSGPGPRGAKLLIVAVLLTIVGVLLCVVTVLLVWVSVALSMLFTGLPLVLLHALLRSLGH